MESDSDVESMEGQVEPVKTGKKQAADWGKTKFNYYYTDYVDKDYPSELTAKEQRLASFEQEEALRLQRKLTSTLDDLNLEPVIDLGGDDGDILELIESQNKALLEAKGKKNGESSTKKRKVTFQDEEMGSDECEFNDEDDEEGDDDDDDENDSNEGDEPNAEDGRRRRPINVAIKKNRGLTPYKKKEYRNPRVKHKLKYKKAMVKRRRLVKDARTEFHRYSGEATGIKTSSVRSIKLC